MVKHYPMTEEGKKKLEKELTYLKEVKAKEINEEIKKHHAFCDFSENASFDQMLDEQALLKKKINKIEDQLALSEIIQPKEEDLDTVQLGNQVDFIELGEEEIQTYKVVGSHEADLSENKISIESPIGQSFLGKRAGDVWTIKIPAGVIQVRLIEIH